MTWELGISIIINICAIAYFAGVMRATQVHHDKIIEMLKEQFERAILRLEEKQDKYNNVISRTFMNEERLKVANHRIDDLEKITKGDYYGN